MCGTLTKYAFDGNFQEIEEFVKTDPYTKAGLISSW